MDRAYLQFNTSTTARNPNQFFFFHSKRLRIFYRLPFSSAFFLFLKYLWNDFLFLFIYLLFFFTKLNFLLAYVFYRQKKKIYNITIFNWRYFQRYAFTFSHLKNEKKYKKIFETFESFFCVKNCKQKRFSTYFENVAVLSQRLRGLKKYFGISNIFCYLSIKYKLITTHTLINSL